MISHSQSNVNQVFKMFSLETLTVYCIYIVINWYSNSLLGIRFSWITKV